MVMTYADFLGRRSQCGEAQGFDPCFLPDCLMDFQKALVEWAVRQGRAAVFADCGLGKTLMQLVWAENVVRHTNRPVLVLTPLAVGRQTITEGEKFGIVAGRLGQKAKIVVANYERLHQLSSADYAGVVCDESSILKNFDGKTKAAVTEFMRHLPYRLLCTATAAPNDFDELGTSSEALGGLGYQDMLTKFFKKETAKDYLGWGRTKFRLRSYAESAFWRWVTSWARAIRRPSDLGFGNERFNLPPLAVRETIVKANSTAPGLLFDLPAYTLEDQREEVRRTLPERCAKVAELVNAHNDPAVCWCHLNDEGDELASGIRGAVQVSGADRDEEKEEKLMAFVNGQCRVLVTKPRIAGFGMNFQHCAHVVTFPTHSYESYYQSVRRCWRFGQKKPVTVDMVLTEGAAGTLANLQRKDDQAARMFDRLVAHMNDSLRIDRLGYGTRTIEVPSWLSAS